MTHYSLNEPFESLVALNAVQLGGDGWKAVVRQLMNFLFPLRFTNHFYCVKNLVLIQPVKNKNYPRRIVSYIWWGWMESNHLPSGYEPPALTDELHPLVGIDCESPHCTCIKMLSLCVVSSSQNKK